MGPANDRADGAESGPAPASSASVAEGAAASQAKGVPFWRAKRLSEMTATEWESLCDGCARCCLVKLEDEDTGEVHFTDVSCTLLDAGACRCRAYEQRDTRMPDCVRLTPEVVPELGWLPSSCAYRLVAQGQDLPDWHPLVSGDPRSVHDAGISVRGRIAGPEESFTLEDLVDRVVDWPNEILPPAGR